MSLIVLQHTAVDNFPMNPNYSIATSGEILQGNIVGLDANGFVALAGSTVANNVVPPLGIAGDSFANEYQTTAYAAQLVIGRGIQTAAGNYQAPTRWTQDRVSDNYRETLASGMMTVYIGSGRFATDQYLVTDPWTTSIGYQLYTTTAGLWTVTANGSNGNGAARRVGFLLNAPTAYPSGVPGADAPAAGWDNSGPDTDMSLGSLIQVSLQL
jgi:hypothetical protein